MICFGKMTAAGTKREIIQVTCKFSAIYCKTSDCNCHQKLERFVWEKELVPPSHGWVVFQVNPCKFWNFQTVSN